LCKVACLGIWEVAWFFGTPGFRARRKRWAPGCGSWTCRPRTDPLPPPRWSTSCLRGQKIGDRCYGFKNIFRQRIGGKMAFLTRKHCRILRKMDHNIVFFFKKKNTNFFAENCDDNIDPRAQFLKQNSVSELAKPCLS
jgi:hypothetical protein